MLRAQELTERLKKEIVGQDRAIEALVRSVVVADLGICDPQRPLGTFLLLGPTGTGKSQIGRSLAKILHGSEDAVVAVNCTEFQHPHDVAKLVGAPPGYVGHGQPPFLTQDKLEKKLAIVIFEELEKADRALFDLLLQILDKGELKTGRGEDLCFTNCLILMTSNICAKEMDRMVRSKTIGFNPSCGGQEDSPGDGAHKRIEEACIGAVEDFFRPEFINRVDEIITFEYLKEEHLLSILEKFLLDTRARLAIAGVGTVLSEAAKQFLIRTGANLRYGARPLRRALREHLEFPLASLIAETDPEQNRVVYVEVRNDRLEFCFARLAEGALIY